MVLAATAGFAVASLIVGRDQVRAEATPDPVAAVESAIAVLEASGDTDAALDSIYVAIADEAATRSGAVNSLHLQSAALRLERGDVGTALTYLDMAMRFDTHAPYHDPQAFGVPPARWVLLPAWLAVVILLIVAAIGIRALGRVRSSRPTSSV